MTQKTVQIQIPFQVIVDAIASLGLEEKRQIWHFLDRELRQTETNYSTPPSITDNSNLNSQSQDIPAETNIFYETSGQVLTLEEMIKCYPNQWLLIGEPDLDENFNILRGKVLAYSPDEYEIYNALSLFDVKSKAIEYTGFIPEDLAVLM